MTPGQILHVTCTDPNAIADFYAFEKLTGHELLKTEQQGEVYYFWLQVK